MLPMNRVAIARAFADALDRGDDRAAATLMADDMEFVFAKRSIRGRDAWLAMRAERPPPEHMSEHVESAEFEETAEDVQMRARLVQRWIESGEAAGEQTVLVSFVIVDGLICRIEFAPAP